MAKKNRVKRCGCECDVCYTDAGCGEQGECCKASSSYTYATDLYLDQYQRDIVADQNEAWRRAVEGLRETEPPAGTVRGDMIHIPVLPEFPTPIADTAAVPTTVDVQHVSVRAEDVWEGFAGTGEQSEE